MSINLNNLPYTKPIVSRDLILKDITEWDIFNKYIKTPFKLKEPFSSPFRKDTTPSFAIYTNSEGKLLYNDFVAGGGDCFQFVKYLFNYQSWHEVYSRIAIDFWIDYKYYCSDKIANDFKNPKPKTGTKPPKQRNLNLGVTTREWEDKDFKYWKQFGITIRTLRKYNVYPISHIIFKSIVREKIINADTLAYAYIEKKDSKISYKIYQPHSKYKWFGSVNTSIWQGWSQLPLYDEMLILTKSLKDVMAITQICGLPAVSLQSEKTKPKINVLNQLKKRFSKIYVLYDNDYDKQINYGQEFAHKLCDIFELTNLRIPDNWESKDFSDLVKNEGKDIAKSLLQSLIEKNNNEIPF